MSATDLTNVRWANTVNSVSTLSNVLSLKNIDILSTDVVIGNFSDATGTLTQNVLIISNSKNFQSDLSLEKFISTLEEYNKKNPDNLIRVKLNFDKIEPTFIIILHANILNGPESNSNVVDASKFIEEF